MNKQRKNHQFQWNNKYFMISLYSIFVIFIGSIMFRLIYNFGKTVEVIGHFLTVISPFLIGALIAYMMNPLIQFVYVDIFKNRLHVKQKRRFKVLSVVLSYFVIFIILSVCLNRIIPQLMDSIAEITSSIPELYKTIMGEMTTVANHGVVKHIPEVGRQFVVQNLPKVYRHIEAYIGRSLPMIYDISMQAIRLIINFLIALVISIYFSLDKKILLNAGKRMIYACMTTKQAQKTLVTCRECNQIFGRYLSGKAIDSIIIGILCFICMTIFKIPLTALISVIVGVTNMIPWFGPFIGAIPGICLLAMLNPVAAIKFAILVFVLQQFDGYVLGPKILGDSTGVRPIGILFAIIIGGAYFGAVGMFLGVPVFAVVQYLIETWVNDRLKEKEIDIDLQS